MSVIVEHKRLEKLNKGQEKTFKEMFNKWYENNKDGWAEKHSKEIWQRCNKFLLPYIGDRLIKGIKTNDMVDVLMRINDLGIKGTYNQAKYLPERKKVMQFWADYLDKLKAQH